MRLKKEDSSPEGATPERSPPRLADASPHQEHTAQQGEHAFAPDPAATPPQEPTAPMPPAQEPAAPAPTRTSEQSPAPVPQEPAAPAPTKSPAPPPAAPEPRVPVHPPRRIRFGRGIRLLLVLLLIMAGAGSYGGYWWNWIRGTISTDDAYVDARIVSVASRLPERVESVLASEGDPVTAGQVLAHFASDRLRIRVRQMMAEVDSAVARLNERRNSPRPEEIDVAQAEVRVQEVQLALQEKEVRRAEQLARVKAISAQELERRRAALDGAVSQLEVSRRRRSLLLAGRPQEEIQKAEADLELARARLQGARTDLGDTVLRSPIAGVVARQMVDRGEVVQEGQALFQIVESGKTWVVANLEEDQIAGVREGQPVRIWIDAYPGQEFQGRVGPLYAATLSRFSLLPTSSASGSFIKVTQRVPVRIDWAEDDMPPVYPGLNVVVRIRVAQP